MKKFDNIKRLIYKDCIQSTALAIVFYTLSYVVGGFLTVYTAGVLGNFADAVFELDFSYGISNLWKLLIALGLSVLAVPLIYMAGELSFFIGALKHDRLILGRFFDKTYEKTMEVDEGEVLGRLDMDPIDFRGFFVLVSSLSVTVPLTLLYLLHDSLKASVRFTIVVFAVSFMKLIVPMAVKKLQAKYDNETRNYRTEVRSLENEITKNAHSVKMLGLTDALAERLDRLYREYFQNVFSKSVMCNVLADQVLSFLDTFCVLVILLAGAILVSSGQISAGVVATMTGYFSALNTVIFNVDYVLRKLPILRNLAERMRLFYEGFEENEGIGLEDVAVVEAHNLSFSYADKAAFSDLGFVLHKGMKVAVCGPNGSGKSTLIKVLGGLLKEYTGSLKINGHNLRAVSIGTWRRQFAFVEQDPYLFEGTVRENIQLGNLNADEDVVQTVLEEVGISHLAERQVSMKQNDLSGGEKQKISIARAMIKDAPYLIMDEPSNNLDAESVEWLRNFIEKSTKTVIYVSHEEALLEPADEVVRL